MEDGIEGILPALVDQPLLRHAPIFGEAILIDVSRAIDPIQRSFDCRPQFREQGVIAGTFGVETSEQNE